MRVTLRVCWHSVLLLAALGLTSCAAPPASTSAACQESKLSPENAFFDLEPEGLKLLWRQDLGQLSDRQLRDVYCAGPIVVVEAEGGEIHCLNAANGVWKATEVLRSSLDRAPVFMDQALVLVVKNALCRFDTVTGSLSRPFHPGFAVSTSPLVYGDSLILAGGNGHLQRVSLETGDADWICSLAGWIAQKPAMGDGVVFAAAEGDEAIAVQASDGLELWHWRPAEPSRLCSGVAVLGSRVFLGDDRGFVYALNADTGDVRWKGMAEASIVGRPQTIGTDLLVLTAKPDLMSLDAGADLRKLWQCNGPVRVLAVGDAVVYVLNSDHSVAALSRQSGERLWCHPLPPDCRIVGDANRPALYIANSAGSIIALGELD